LFLGRFSGWGWGRGWISWFTECSLTGSGKGKVITYENASRLATLRKSILRQPDTFFYFRNILLENK
jgi:hypothetical protein